jgi:hypothetical protein
MCLFLTHDVAIGREDWFVATITGCNMLITRGSGYDASQLQHMRSRSRCAGPAAAFEVREDRGSQSGCDWARRSRRRKAQKQKRRQDLVLVDCNIGRLQPCAATARVSGATVDAHASHTTSRNSSRSHVGRCKMHRVVQAAASKSNSKCGCKDVVYQSFFSSPGSRTSESRKTPYQWESSARLKMRADVVAVDQMMDREMSIRSVVAAQQCAAEWSDRFFPLHAVRSIPHVYN